jgi:hypothetical protein
MHGATVTKKIQNSTFFRCNWRFLKILLQIKQDEIRLKTEIKNFKKCPQFMKLLRPPFILVPLSFILY